MSTTTKTEFIFNEAEPLQILAGANTYKVGKSGLEFLKDGEFVAADAKQLEDAAAGFSQAFKEFIKKAPKDDHLTAVLDMHENLQALGAKDQLARVLKIVDDSKELVAKVKAVVAGGNIADKTAIKDITKQLLAHDGNVVNLLKASEYNTLLDIKNYGDITKYADKIKSGLTEFSAIAKSAATEDAKVIEGKLKTLFRTKSPLLIEHMPDNELREFTTIRRGGGALPNPKAIAEAVQKEMSSIRTNATSLFDELAKAAASGNKEKLGSLTKQLEQLEASHDGAYKELIGKVLRKNHPPMVVAQIEALEGVGAKVTPLRQLAESAEKAGNSAAKEGSKLLGGGKWYSFVHTAESAGPAVEKIGKIRWGKVGVVAGAAAVIAGVIAAVGGKGPGERAEEIDRQRAASAQAPAAGIA